MMRIRAAMIGCLAISVLAGPLGSASALAQPAPAPDYGAPITLDQAKEAAAAAQVEARKNGWRMAVSFCRGSDRARSAAHHLTRAAT